MPGLVLKAEAIVGPDQLVPYLGAHERYRPECDLAYDNQLMVMLWSSLATRDARLAVQALGRRRPVPVGTSYVTYVRGHDDIGWAVADEDAWAVGLDPQAHRAFLAAFYADRYPGSFARGVDFGVNPATADVRTSGAAASLTGLSEALDEGSSEQVEIALRRLETLYATAYSFGGVPLVYMGDELAMRNDPDWDADPRHADDNRWIHRPRMDWEVAERRHDLSTPEGRMFTAVCRLGRARRASQALRSDAAARVLPLDDPHVLAYVRSHPRAAPVLGLACFSDTPRTVEHDVLGRAGIDEPVHLHSTAGRLDWSRGRIALPAWGFLWVTNAH
jgi:amylosucrase